MKRELLNKTEFEKLDAEWKQYRKLHRLDAYGIKNAEPADCNKPRGDDSISKPN